MDYIACQATLSMVFPRQQYWSGSPFPSSRNLPDSGIKPGSLALQAESFLTEPPVKPSQVALVVTNPPANAGDMRAAGSMPGLGKSPGGKHGNPLQDSCLENPMDRGTWWATVRGISQESDMTEQLTLSLYFHIHVHTYIIYLYFRSFKNSKNSIFIVCFNQGLNSSLIE